MSDMNQVVQSSQSVSNEVVVRTKAKRNITFKSVIRDERFLNVVSLIVFFSAWHYFAATGPKGTSAALADRLPVAGLLALAMTGLICIVTETLPAGFQRSEFLLDKGAIDMIVDRRELRDQVARVIALLQKLPVAA